jgi:hypothetical protein
MTVFALIKPEELVDQAVLGLQGNGHELGWLSLTAAFQDEGSSSVMTVVPGCFDQEAPHMDIAGLGNGAAVFAASGRVLGRHETEIGHEGARGSEASNIADLDQERQGGEGLDASETAECFDGFPVEWERRIAFEFSVQGSLLCLKVFKVLKFGGEGCLKWSLEAPAQFT